MSRVLLLMASAENRRLLEQALVDAGRTPVAPVVNDADALRHALEQPFDLCIVDGQTLDRVAEDVQARREREQPALAPVLLIAARQEPAVVARHLGRVVDEWLAAPVHPLELRARVDNLLRLRHLSQELAEKARLDGVLLAARTFEHELCNKLVATVGYTDRLARDETLPEAVRQRAARAHQGAAEASAIVRRVLARAESNGIRVTDWGETGETTIDVSPAA